MSQDKESTDIALRDAATDEVARGPFKLGVGRWICDFAEMEKAFPVNNLSGQLVIPVLAADGFAQITIPTDLEDGHSGGEAMRALWALNSYQPLRDAMRGLLEMVGSGIDCHGTTAGELMSKFQAEIDAAEAAMALGEDPNYAEEPSA